jgi:hypothetical protein
MRRDRAQEVQGGERRAHLGYRSILCGKRQSPRTNARVLRLELGALALARGLRGQPVALAALVGGNRLCRLSLCAGVGAWVHTIVSERPLSEEDGQLYPNEGYSTIVFQ